MRMTAAVILLLTAWTGCFWGRPGPRAVAGGGLVVDWTIAGSTHASDCPLTQSSSARIEVFDDHGVKANSGADVQDCAAFATSFNFSFYPGSYHVEVTMLRSDGSASSTTAQGDAAVFSNETASVDFDFPPSSFF